MEQILVKDKGSMGRFFKMLWKARLPYLWIIVYLAVSVLITNIGISVTEYTAEMFAGNVNFATIILPFLLYEALSIIMGSVSGVLNNLCQARIDRNLRRMIWKKSVRLPLRFFENNKPKELISRITTDVTTISQLVMQVFIAVLTTGYTAIATIQKIGSYDKQLMLSLLVILPVNVLIGYIMGKWKFGILDVVNKKNAELTQTVSERTNHFLLIKSMGNEKKEYRIGENKMKELYNSNIVNSWMGISGPMYIMAGMMQFIVIVLVGRKFYADGTLSLAQWIAYYGFATNLVNILTAYCGYWTQLKSSQGATHRIATIMEEEEEDLETGKTAENLSGDIVLQDVCFSYENKKVFDHLNVTIPTGKVVAVIGPSGGGKTTLLNAIERMYPLESGRILFGGEDIANYSLKSFREQIAYVTQESVLFSGTLKDNLLFGIKRSVSEEELKNACKEAGILEYIENLPNQFDTSVGESGSTLSGGQRQRIAIARALLKKANYLFLDEATAAMDIRSKDSIWNAIRRCMKNRTVFMVAHDKQTVQKADYIIVLENGMVAAQGERAEVAKQNAYYQKLVAKGGTQE